MLNLTLPKILSLLSTWGYALILPISIIEGPIVAVIAGFLVSLEQLNFFGVYFILLVGDFFGDLLYYYIGRWGHGPLAQRIVARLGATPERRHRLEEAFHKHSFKVLLLNKTQAAGGFVLYYAGAVRMPLGRFLWINVLGSIPKIAFFEVIGFYFGKSYFIIQKYLNYAGLVMLLIPLGLLAIYWLIRRYAKKEEPEI
jgi:membrane protein DedA with SNARE-associated domain